MAAPAQRAAAQMHASIRGTTVYRPFAPPPLGISPVIAQEARLAYGNTAPRVATGIAPLFNRSTGKLSYLGKLGREMEQAQSYLDPILQYGGGAATIGSEAGLGYVGLGAEAGALFGKELDVALNAIASLFAGKPKGEDTAQAANRLMSSHNPYVQTFGRQLAYLSNNGVVLSDSNPKVQTLISALMHQANVGLQETLGWTRQQAAAKLANILSSHTAASGASIPASSSLSTPMAQSSAPPAASFYRQIQAKRAYLGSNPVLTPSEAGELVGSFTGQPELAVAGKLAGELIGRVQKMGTSISDFVGNFYGQGSTQRTYGNSQGARSQTGYNPQPTPSPSGFQPFDESRVIDVTKPCPGCDGGRIPAIVNQTGDDGGGIPALRGQLSQLQQETRVEQGQLSQQQIQQNQQELEHFRQLERQPSSTRNITQELQQKQQLAQQIQREIEQLQSGQQSYSSDNSASSAFDESKVIDLSKEPQLEEVPSSQSAQQSLFVQGESAEGYPSPHAPGSVKFCVQCTSQAESLKFLNGEPAQCSVVSD
jgi:hypothetical protein